jgi:hypothetical protein
VRADVFRLDIFDIVVWLVITKFVIISLSTSIFTSSTPSCLALWSNLVFELGGEQEGRRGKWVQGYVEIDVLGGGG